ncbi:MAG: FHA domain-containing protein, partial [Planctomycetales bacterium]|nr:FHA domain-containing protein [Planctomycetales bacterium]
MPDLIAQGAHPQHRWRRRLPENRTLALGREAGPLSAMWDAQISRLHADLQWKFGKLHVTRRPEARNAIYVRGREVKQFTLLPGEHFVIGTTTFTLADEQLRVHHETPFPVTEQTFSVASLHEWQFRDADKRIHVLGRIPEIISGSTDDEEMLIRLINILFEGIPPARAAAVVRWDRNRDDEEVEILKWDRREQGAERFSPSVKLIRHAVSTGESVVHVWNSPGQTATYTQADNVDWAFCIPLTGRASPGWAIYVAGGFGSTGEQQTPQD